MNAKNGFTTWETAVNWLRDQPDQQDLVRDAYYDDPLAAAAERYRNSEEWLEIRSRLSGSTGAALDLGAGRGIASYALAKDGFVVTALEPDGSALVGAAAIRFLARETGVQIAVVQEYSEQLPFPNASFDVVFARAVLHHMNDLEQSCREIYRVLKPGGMFVAVREHVISRQSDLASFLQSHPLHKLYGGEMAFLLGDYTRSLERAGFVIKATIHPLENPINYFPLTKRTLSDEVVLRVPGPAFGRSIFRMILRSDFVLQSVLRIAARFDSRPGRLFSFFCQKPQPT